MAAVNLKGGDAPPVHAVLIEQNTDSSIFFRFIQQLLELGVLQRGDVFILDNCTIHMHGDNSGSQDYLFCEYEILMIPLPPYHPDFKPTELVFQTTLQRLRKICARYKCWAMKVDAVMRETTFKECITFVLQTITNSKIMSFYRKQGYGY